MILFLANSFETLSFYILSVTRFGQNKKERACFFTLFIH